jgi:hypothetical protein
MTSDSDQVSPEVEQKASDADRSPPDSDQPEYMIRTKPTRMWPNALETKQQPSTTELMPVIAEEEDKRSDSA